MKLSDAIGTDIDTRVEMITPEIAQRYLRTQKKNRHISPAVLRKYTAHMERGEWRFDATPIRFDSGGHLIDGQHRLTSVIKSERPQQFLVVRGLDKETFSVMDQGKNRTAGDILSVYGEQNANVLASVLGMLYAHLKTNGRRITLAPQERPTPHELHELLDNGHSDVVHSIHNVIGPWGKLRNLAPPSIMAYLHYWISATTRASGGQVDAFFDSLASGVDLPEGSPIYACREKLLVMRTKLASRSKSYRLDIRDIVVHAWNKHVSGETVHIIRPPKEFPHPL